jgi:hypothetical protein
MLYQVLEEIEKARGPVLVKDLGQKLNIDPGVLIGMIQFWIQKGRLCDDDEMAGEGMTCAGGCGGASCGSNGITTCTFVAKMPKTYSIKKQDITGPSDAAPK